MECNTVERVIKTETTQEENKKGVGKLGWFMSKTSTATSTPHVGEPKRTQGVTDLFPEFS